LKNLLVQRQNTLDNHKEHPKLASQQAQEDNIL